jgi:hypothetical protein
MHAEELAALLTKDLARVLPPDFRVSQGAEFSQATREFPGGRVRIQLPLHGHPPRYTVGSLYVGIRFHAVQTPIEEAQRRHGVFAEGQDDTVREAFQQAAPDVPPFPHRAITDARSHAEVFALIEQTLRQRTLPFIEQYSDLRRVHARAMELPVNERARFLGPEVPLQLMALKRLTGASDYETYAGQVLAFAVEAARDNPRQYRNFDRVVVDLHEALRSV